MSTLKLATWNVNSLRQRLPHLFTWLESAQPDVVALQETKVTDDLFPARKIEETGYRAVFCGQKSYNGVALLSRLPITDIETDMIEVCDPQRRILAATVNGIRIVNLYVPNGSEVGCEKYAYKLDWLSKITNYLGRQLREHRDVVVMGDFNIAPEDRDVHDADLWRDRIMCSAAERLAFQAFADLGFIDCFRLFEQTDRSFSWWDYRQGAFRRNLGLRIDHILASEAVSRHCQSSTIDLVPRKSERPSDHTPVLASFSL
jgi:exodeoxyribonuclease III